MDTKKYLKLNDIEAYKIAFNLSNYVWDIVTKWERFSTNTIGGQFVRSVDSVSANIAEGFGRYGKKDKIRFYRIGLSSATESLDWKQKSITRKLVSQEQYDYIFQELQKLPKAINSLISFTNSRLKI